MTIRQAKCSLSTRSHAEQTTVNVKDEIPISVSAYTKNVSSCWNTPKFSRELWFDLFKGILVKGIWDVLNKTESFLIKLNP